jgi:transitional endoplasmic reticulum ATPase
MNELKELLFNGQMNKQGTNDRSGIHNYRGDYLTIFANLNAAHQKITLGRSVDFLWDLMTEREKIVLLRLLRAPAKQRANPDCIDAGENLPLLFKDASDSDSGRLIVAAKQMLRIMGTTTQGSLNWKANKFLRQLARALNLNDEECRFLYALCLLELSPISSSLAYVARSEAEFARFCSLALSMPNNRILELCTPGSRLLSAGLITQASDSVRLGEDLLDGFRDDLTIHQFITRKYKIDTDPVYDLASFDFPLEPLQVSEALLRSEKPCNIMLYGKPGTGKTELARALVRAADRKVMLVEPKETTRHENRLSRVQLAAFFAHRAVIIVDEAEDILNTESRDRDALKMGLPTKSLLNTFFDQCGAKIVWIVNDYGGIHESTMRRFHFKMRFDGLSLKQRTHALDLILSKHGERELLAEPFVKKIAQDDFITPGILNRVIESYSATKHLLPDLSAQKVIPILIASHKPEQRKSLPPNTGNEYYAREMLNVTGEIDSLLDTARKFALASADSTHGLNILLHGLPGTGKTEFVRHIAAECGLDLTLKRGSDLLSMFVGGTEAHIAAAFRDAEKNRSILLIDEADTFFIPRESAQRSWEISQTNEFLNQMENHKTLVFCCTNFLSNFDTAAMRRFHFKLEFKPMQPEKRVTFFLNYFESLLSGGVPESELAARLNSLSKLTPGDFKAVKQRYSFRDANSVVWHELVNELASECKYKPSANAKVIGF